MASLFCHLHFWSLQPLYPTANTEVGIHSYLHKSTGIKGDVDACRRDWAEGRGVPWHLPNHRPDKLRDNLRECEELLSSQKLVCFKWKTLRHCVVLLETGTLVTFTVARHSGDVEGIVIDRTLMGQLDRTIDRAQFLDHGLLVTHPNDSRVGHVFSSVGGGGAKKSGVPPTPFTLGQAEASKRVEKMTLQDLKVHYTSVKGMADGRVDRSITVNSQEDLIAVWWRDQQENGFQWSSQATGSRHNLVFIRIKSNGKLESVSQVQTTYDPISVCFSSTQSNTLWSVEKTAPTSYECSSYLCIDKKVTRQLFDCSIDVPSKVTVCARDKDEIKILFGCDNGSLILYDIKSDFSYKEKAFFSPITSIHWHPAGSVVVVGGNNGELQCFDCALSPVMFQVANEVAQGTPILELGSYLRTPVHLEQCGWASEPREGEGHSGCYDNLLLMFNRGPVVMIRFELGVLSRGKLGKTELMAEYIHTNQLQQAVRLLQSVRWTKQTQDAFNLLTLLVNHLLTLPLNADREELIEASLGTFYGSGLAKDIDATFREHVNWLSRRFFFILLRHKRFEKAFRLAVDIGAKDLFMDLHYTALDCQEPALAKLSKRKAESLTSGSAHTDSLQEPGSWTSGKTTPQELLDAMISPVRLQFNMEEDMPESSETDLGNPVPQTGHRDSMDAAFESAGRRTSLEKSEAPLVGQQSQSSAVGGILDEELNEGQERNTVKGKVTKVTDWGDHNKVDVMNFGYF